MKKGLIIFSSTVLLMACNTKENLQLTASIKAVDPLTVVYLEKLDPVSNEPIVVDSTLVSKQGKAVFKAHQSGIDFGYLRVKYRIHKAFVILEPGEISVQYDLNSSTPAIIGGTISNDQYQQFQDKVHFFQNQIQQFNTQSQKQYSIATQENDTVKLRQLKSTSLELQERLSSFLQDYPKENPTSILQLINLSNTYKNPGISKETLMQQWQELPQEFKQTSIAVAIKNHLDSLADSKVAIGKVAPDFKAPMPNGETFSLQQALGKVTIIDFWAAWCAPCRVENPVLVQLYKDYHDKGLNVIGVSLDKEKQKWTQAIMQDKLPWPQVSNLLYFKDPIAHTYEIKAIPATFILDQNGVIIAKDLTGVALRKKISELLD